MLDRRGNATAGFRDLFIGRAGSAHRVLVGAIAAEHEVGVAVDQTRGDPGATERVDPAGAIAGELGALADTDDLAVGYADRAVLDDAHRATLERRDVAVDEQPVPHLRRLRRALLLASKRWRAGPTSASFWQRRTPRRRLGCSARRSPPDR